MQKEYHSPNLQPLVAAFRTAGAIAAIRPHGSGHIHDTFLVCNASPAGPDYLLQRLNNHVFRDVPGLMENIVRITTFLRQKLEATPGAEPDRETLTPIPTLDGRYYLQDEAGAHWRMFLFIRNTKTYDVVETPQQALQGGKAFGRFQALLADLPGPPLHETIPDFHNVEKRLRDFREAVEKNPKGRRQKVEEEIGLVEKRSEEMGTILRLGREGKIPTRITHNDTKFNNVLLNEQDQAQCVIDLDTVMPGFAPYDFGDAIRTTANTAAEDEADLQKIEVDLPLFAAYAQGYLSEAGGFLTQTEVDHLAFGCKVMAYSQTVRFLTDYLNGDTYYKVLFPEHNLQRTRAQLQLLHRLDFHFLTLQEIIRKIKDSF
jgi:Ser/Thr protein kinase RdoA (MazF antagonist)